jgi:uncharacterized membrane protein YhaH (DUF805 family)
MFHYLFSFQGRINRAKLWAFILVGIAWEIIVVVIACFGFNLSALSVQAGQHPDPAALFAGQKALIAGIAIAVLVVAYFWAGLAVAVKRLHDREKSAAWLLVFWVLPLVLEIVGFALSGVGALTNHASMTPLSTALFLGALAIVIWAFVELYCLRGTSGENRFGPDPLAG